MNNAVLSFNVIDPKPNKEDEIKADLVLNEQDEKLSKDDKQAIQQSEEESWGQDKDGIKKEAIKDTNVDNEIVNGENGLGIVND